MCSVHINTCLKSSYEVHDLLTFSSHTLYHALKQPAMTLLLFLLEMTHNHFGPLIQIHDSPGIFSNHRYEPHARATETPNLVQIPEPGVHSCCVSFTLHEKICGPPEHRWCYTTERPKLWHLARFSVVFFLALQRKRSRNCVLTLINRHKASRALYTSDCFLSTRWCRH